MFLRINIKRVSSRSVISRTRLSRRFADQTRRFYRGGVGNPVLPVFVFSPICRNRRPKRVTENLVFAPISDDLSLRVCFRITPVHQKKLWIRPSRVPQFFDPSSDFSLVEPCPVSGLYTRKGAPLVYRPLTTCRRFPRLTRCTLFRFYRLSECDNTTTVCGWSVVFDTCFVRKND